MKINQDLCIGCGQCVPYCPVKAIALIEEKAEIDFYECAECNNYLRMADCPVDAIYQQELVWPRSVRSLLSYPLTIAEESGISGRGTEEMKTNEVTGRFRVGYAGIGLEIGRPVLGARFYDVEKVAQAVARMGVEFEKINPTTSLMANPKTGKFKEDLLVFNDIANLKSLLGALKEADLGMSVVVSGLFDRVEQCCREVGLEKHTVNQSLGPNRKTPSRLDP